MEKIKDFIAAHMKLVLEKGVRIEELETQQKGHRNSIKRLVFNYIVANPDKLHQNTVFECEATSVPKTVDDLVLGDWDCPTSPTNECVYNGTVDGILDYCLFCGNPDERK